MTSLAQKVAAFTQIVGRTPEVDSPRALAAAQEILSTDEGKASLASVPMFISATNLVAGGFAVVPGAQPKGEIIFANAEDTRISLAWNGETAVVAVKGVVPVIQGEKRGRKPKVVEAASEAAAA